MAVLKINVVAFYPPAIICWKGNRSSWKNVATLIKIDASREIKGVLQKETRYYIKIKGVLQKETRYYISDETVSNPSYFLSLSRAHWGIENQQHWHLDVTFKEDVCGSKGRKCPFEFIHSPKICTATPIQPKG